MMSDDRVKTDDGDSDGLANPGDGLEPSDGSTEALEAHIEAHLGSVDYVIHEIASDFVHLDVHVIAPHSARPYFTLATTGMSDLPMVTPDGHDEYAYSELMLALPPDCDLPTDERWQWPVYWLRLLARFSHENGAWLWDEHSMASDDPPKPLHESVGFEGLFLSRPRTTSDAFRTLRIREDKIVHFHAVYPVYAGEMDLKLAKGADELNRRFDRHGVSELVDPKRKDVSRQRWWKRR